MCVSIYVSLCVYVSVCLCVYLYVNSLLGPLICLLNKFLIGPHCIVLKTVTLPSILKLGSSNVSTLLLPSNIVLLF